MVSSTLANGGGASAAGAFPDGSRSVLDATVTSGSGMAVTFLTGTATKNAFSSINGSEPDVSPVVAGCSAVSSSMFPSTPFVAGGAVISSALTCPSEVAAGERGSEITDVEAMRGSTPIASALLSNSASGRVTKVCRL